MTDLFAGLVLTPPSGFVPSNNGPSTDTVEGPDDAPPRTDPQCEICARDIPWSGRGRRPKRCDDHKTRTKDTAGGETARAPRVAAAEKRHNDRLNAIVGDLHEGLGELAGTIVGIAPVTAATVALTGPDAVVSLVRVASDYPRFLDGLEKAAKAVPFLSIAKFIAALVLAVSVDMGRLAPVGLAAEYLKVADAAENAGWRPPEEIQKETAQQDWSVPPPPRFKL